MNIKSILLLLILSFILHVILIKSISDKMELEQFRTMKKGNAPPKKEKFANPMPLPKDDDLDMSEEELDKMMMEDDFDINEMESLLDTEVFDTTTKYKDVNIQRGKDIMDGRDVSISMEKRKLKEAYERDYIKNEKGFGSVLLSNSGLDKLQPMSMSDTMMAPYGQ